MELHRPGCDRSCPYRASSWHAQGTRTQAYFLLEVFFVCVWLAVAAAARGESGAGRRGGGLCDPVFPAVPCREGAPDSVHRQSFDLQLYDRDGYSQCKLR